MRGEPNTGSGATRIVLVIALAASLVASYAVYAQHTAMVDRLSFDLAEKSLQVDQQQQVIDEYASLVTVQQGELAEKGAQLDTLELKVDSLTYELESKENLILEKSVQAADLEMQAFTLKSLLDQKDKDIARITLENESVKRVHVAHYGLGINENGKGTVFKIDVDVVGAGAGSISVDVGEVQFETVFQDAVRTAALAASGYTGISISDKDIIVTVVNDSDRVIKVDGPSAGAVLAAMISAGLEEKQLDPSVLVTGTIRSDGTIGRVGGIPGKADAAVEFGAEKLVVPKSQTFTDGRIEVEGVSDLKQLARLMIKN